MKRKIITIDETKCTGCSLCIPNCPEGAIQIIDNKARLVSDLMCDGLGACLGHCPEGAISVEEREADAYDERKVMVNIVKAGAATITAHLRHLIKHGQKEFINEALEYLKENNIVVPDIKENLMNSTHGGCPGSRTRTFKPPVPESGIADGKSQSQLAHWPIQMHLISPQAPHYKGSDMVLAADCVAFSFGDFHKDFLQGKTLAIACPKLDEGLDVYGEKIVELIDIAKINTLTVIMMQVPCCGGLLQLAKQAAAKASRKIPVKSIIISLQGEVIQEEWV
jgi:NAD-dependent dihydropyrimidine dehydrogenase PreA subunit